jgi:hypothetical protein
MSSDPFLRRKLTVTIVLAVLGAGLFLWDSAAARWFRAEVAKPGSGSQASEPLLGADAAAATTDDGSSTTAEDVSASPAEAGDASPDSAGAAASGKPPPVRPLPFAALATMTGEPFRSVRLKAPRAIGAGVVLGPPLRDPMRVVVDTGDGRGKIVDVRTAKGTSWVGKPVTVAARAGLIVLEPVKGKPALVRLRDGKAVVPKLDGAPDLKEVFWCAREEGDTALLAAIASDGSKLYGVPTDDSFETFALHPLPLSSAQTLACWPTAAGGWEFSVGEPPMITTAHTPCFLPHQDRCVRARVAPGDAAPKCVEYDPFVAAGQVPGPETLWSTDGWALSSSWFAREGWDRLVYYDEALGLPRADGSAPGCDAHYVLARVPRAFVVCKGFDATPGAGLRTLATAVVTPEAVLRLDERTINNFTYGFGGEAPYPVIAYAGDKLPGKDGELLPPKVETWIDLVGAKGLTTPPMIPLGGAPFGGVHRVALAAPADEPNEVWVLDFEAGTRERVGTVDDCPGVLGDLTGDDDGAPPVLACTTRPPPHTVSTTLLWAEILDRKERARIRTDLHPDVFFDDGTVILSTSRTRAAETKLSPGRLYAAEWRSPQSNSREAK